MTPPPPGDTIFALSTGAPPAAIGIVRVSGPAAAFALEQVAGRLPEPRRARQATLRDGNGAVIDHALLLWMPGPGSATGEDLAEFHVHGGRAVIAALIARLGALPDLRPALPGEFTRRAVLNGRMDLTEAEGLADLLAAETADQHRRALRMAEGGLGRVIERWRTALLDMSAQIEAAIEFGESDEEVGTAIRIDEQVEALAREAEQMLAAPPAERLRDGIRVVVAGPPNSGKSSLINALAGRDVALATPIAGTTRDVIEAPVSLDGLALVLTDTAGLRDAGDEVERLGIARAEDAIAAADLILWCGAPEACPDPARSMMLHTRADARRDPKPEGSLAVSVIDRENLIMLRRNIRKRAQAWLGDPEALSLNGRQRELVATIATESRVAASCVDPILQAEHLRRCRDGLDRLAGRAGVEDMLDAVFGRFCLGK